MRHEQRRPHLGLRTENALATAFGVAAVMVWIYYTAIIVLLGAQVSRATRDVLEARTSLPGTEE